LHCIHPAKAVGTNGVQEPIIRIRIDIGSGKEQYRTTVVQELPYYLGSSRGHIIYSMQDQQMVPVYQAAKFQELFLVL